MTEITRDHDGPSPSDTPPMEGTQVTDASSMSTTREAINLLSNTAKLSSEMLQLREPSNVLSRNASRVDDIYETVAKKLMFKWPGMPNFENCSMCAAMCC